MPDLSFQRRLESRPNDFNETQSRHSCMLLAGIHIKIVSAAGGFKQLKTKNQRLKTNLPGQDLNLECEDQNLECCQLHHRVMQIQSKYQILALANRQHQWTKPVRAHQSSNQVCTTCREARLSGPAGLCRRLELAKSRNCQPQKNHRNPMRQSISKAVIYTLTE